MVKLVEYSMWEELAVFPSQSSVENHLDPDASCWTGVIQEYLKLYSMLVSKCWISYLNPINNYCNTLQPKVSRFSFTTFCFTFEHYHFSIAAISCDTIQETVAFWFACSFERKYWATFFSPRLCLMFFRCFQFDYNMLVHGGSFLIYMGDRLECMKEQVCSTSSHIVRQEYSLLLPGGAMALYFTYVIWNRRRREPRTWRLFFWAMKLPRLIWASSRAFLSCSRALSHEASFFIYWELRRHSFWTLALPFSVLKSLLSHVVLQLWHITDVRSAGLSTLQFRSLDL